MSADDAPIDFDDGDDIEIVPGGELGNMFLVKVNGQTKDVPNTPKNKLLYKHGLYSKLHDEDGPLVISESDPYVALEPTHYEDVYTIWYGNRDIPVQNPPSDAHDLLKGVVDAIEREDYSRINDIYTDVLNNQVRRQVINQLSILFPSTEVVPIDEGWVVRGLFTVTWDAGVYLVTTDRDEGSYRRGGGGVTQLDETQETFELEPQNVPEPKTVKIQGSEYTLTDVEMEFLAKIRYLLDFEDHIDEDAFVQVLRRHVRGEVVYADEDGSDSVNIDIQ